MPSARAQVPEHCQIRKLGWVSPKDSATFPREPVRHQPVSGYGQGNEALNPFVRYDGSIRDRRELCAKCTHVILGETPSGGLGISSELHEENRSKRICGVPLRKNAGALASAPE